MSQPFFATTTHDDVDDDDDNGRSASEEQQNDGADNDSSEDDRQIPVSRQNHGGKDHGGDSGEPSPSSGESHYDKFPEERDNRIPPPEYVLPNRWTFIRWD